MLIPIVQPPSDGFMDFEKLFIKDVFLSIYKAIDDPLTKFIMLAYFECGYTQEQISDMINYSQPMVLKRIKATQEKLRNSNLYQEL